MTSPAIQILGEAFANISGTIKEAVRQDAQNTPNPEMAEHFEKCIRRECSRMRSAGMDGVAEAVQGLASPIATLLREGW